MLGLLAVGSLVAWETWLEERIVPKRWGVVVPGAIYRSGQISQGLIADVLKRNGIGLIIDLTGPKPESAHQRAELVAAYHLGIEHARFPQPGDGCGDPDVYADALALLLEAKAAGRPVLVHCSAGTQRTGVLVALYRLLAENAPRETVLAELERYGWEADGNAKLLQYADEHVYAIGEQLVRRGHLDGIPPSLPRLAPRAETGVEGLTGPKDPETGRIASTP